MRFKIYINIPFLYKKDHSLVAGLFLYISNSSTGPVFFVVRSLICTNNRSLLLLDVLYRLQRKAGRIFIQDQIRIYIYMINYSILKMNLLKKHILIWLVATNIWIKHQCTKETKNCCTFLQKYYQNTIFLFGFPAYTKPNAVF